MTNTNNTSKGQESHSQSANLNPLETAKGIESINRFIQGIYENSQNNPDLFQWLLEHPVEVVKIWDNYQKLEKRCQDLEKSLSQAAQVIATKDTGATAVSGQQHYELGLKYDTLKGNFESVSVHVFDIFLQSNTSFPSDQRNQKIAEIESSLSQIILIDSFFPKANNLTNQEFSSASKEIIRLIVSKSQIAELKNKKRHNNIMNIFPSAISHETEDKLNELFKNKLQQVLINGLATLTKECDPILNLNEIMKAIESWFIQELNVNKNDFLLLRDQLHQLANKGLSFVIELSKATPPGRLWIEEKNTQFDRNKHQLHQMCGDSQVEFTIFPGYCMDSFVFRPALVFTK